MHDGDQHELKDLRGDHRRCPGCGYDLRAAPVGHHCPECGAVIPHAADTFLLRHADQHWLRHVHLGVRIVHAGRIVLSWTILLYFGVLLLGLLFLPKEVDSPTEHVFGIVRSWFALLLGLTVLTAFGGLFVASTAEPHLTGATRLRRSALAANQLVAAAGVGVCWFIGLRGSAPTLSAMELFTVHLCLASIALSVVGAALLSLEWERRSEARSLDRLNMLRGMVWITAVGPVILCGLAWLGPLRWMDSGGWSPPSRSAFRNVYFLTLLLWLAVLVMMSRSRTALKSEMDLSAVTKV
jgi:hypothetical protein